MYKQQATMYAINITSSDQDQVEMEHFPLAITKSILFKRKQLLGLW